MTMTRQEADDHAKECARVMKIPYYVIQTLGGWRVSEHKPDFPFGVVFKVEPGWPRQADNS